MTSRLPLSLLIDDPILQPNERRIYNAAGVGSALLVPLLLGDECFGVLVFYA